MLHYRRLIQGICCAVLLATITTTASADVDWWDANYQYRTQITVTNNSDVDALPIEYTTNLSFDHATMVADEKSLSGGDDVRIVYWNGSTNAEHDRMLALGSSWNPASGNTTIVFQTQAEIPANDDSADAYWMYYGDSSADGPPAEGNALYLVLR